MLLIKRNLTLINSTLNFLKSSSIITNGCINISNSNITVDLSTLSLTKNDGDSILLFNSTLGCLSGNMYSITYLNKPNCTSLKSYINSYSLYVILRLSDCNETPAPFNLLIIAIIILGSVIGIAIIVLALICAIPSIRHKILPYENKRKKREKQRDKVM